MSAVLAISSVSEHDRKSAFQTFICRRVFAIVRDLGCASAFEVGSNLDIARAWDLVLQVGASCECGVICRLSEAVRSQDGRDDVRSAALVISAPDMMAV